MTVEIEAGDRALVTGASGFVGSAVVAALRAGGKSVRTLLRATSPRDNLPPDVEIAIGDLRDPAAMKAAMRGVRYLFHVAADYRLWARDPGEIVAANVEGTRNAMEAAAAAGVARIVYTSSVATLALRAGAIGDERAGLDEAQAIGQGLPAVIVNPSTPIGPRDRRPTPTGRILVEAANGRMPAYVDTGLNLVHVDDVAAGHLAALARGRIGERYILGGDNVAFGDLLATIAAATGGKPPRVRLPRAPLFPLAFAAEAVARITGREPFITADGLRMAKNRMFFTSAKAEREIGYVHRPWREGLDDALAWFRVKGLIP